MDDAQGTPAGRLHEQVAIVTGGASGIGAAVVRRFAEEGARQVIVGLPSEEQRAASLVDELGRERAVFVAGDVTEAGTAERAAGVALERFARLDVLVNNAGWTTRECTCSNRTSSSRAVSWRSTSSGPC